MAIQSDKSKKNKHLTIEDRKEIEDCLNKQMTFKAIGKLIDKDPTTISYEVKHHLQEHRNAYVDTIGITGAMTEGANVSITTTEAKLYADDGLAESVKEFVEGSISIGTDDLETETEADILGATVDAAGDIENSTDDAAPWMQIGFMAVRIRRNKKQYRGVLYKKVQFAVPSEDNQTKGQNITFTTPTLTGTIAALADGTWRKKSKWFDSADAADEWVDTAMSGT